jgi:hypothetical protein
MALGAHRRSVGQFRGDAAIADAAGITDVGPILITPDGKSYVYEYGRTLSDPYLVEGIK